MRSIILANGQYGDLGAYHNLFRDDDLIICADGGANYAYRLGLMPSIVIGDMDSILPEVREHFSHTSATIKKYPRRKDFTDTQLALAVADEAGCDEIVLIGTLGKRLDHTLANLYSGIDVARRNKPIMHFSPDCQVYLTSKRLEINGQPGDTVSILTLTEKSEGVSLEGFEYPLNNVVLENSKPYTVSNVLAAKKGIITVDNGVLAAFYVGRV
ncbi:MAG: thiamine diphosphokinase [Syntrophomonadaceae bacterium]|jgi:thiamine pyrophosphokinase